MTTSVELRGGPLDGQVMELSMADYRQMMRFQGAEIAAYVEYVGAALDIEEDMVGMVRRTGRYRIPDHRDSVAEYIGEEPIIGGALPPIRDWPR